MARANDETATGRIERRSVRRRFDRAAATYSRAARLEAEIGSRMLERLDYLRIQPGRILDAGSGPAREAAALSRRYPAAKVFASDFSVSLLRAARRQRSLLERLRAPARPLAVCADLESLPFADASFDLAWSNMTLHWLDEPLAALREIARVLVPEAPLLVSSLGPDSLKELRSAAGAGRVHEFMDMHDLGDRIVAAGFSAPVIDAERITITYPHAEALLAELRESGQTSSLASRPRGLAGRGFLSRVREALPRDDDGRIAITFEVVYALAWRAAPRRAQGEAVVRFDPGQRAQR